MIDRMDRLRELRGLRRSIAEKDAERAKLARAEFERKVHAAEGAHARAVADATTRRRAALDALSDQPAGPLTVARMANVHGMVEHEIGERQSEWDEARGELDEAQAELAEKRDVLAQFLKKEEATDAAVERWEEATRHLRDAEEEDDGER